MSQPPAIPNLAAELLGAPSLPESYMLDVERLHAACCEYHRTHGQQFFAFDWPDKNAKILAPLRFLLLIASDQPTRDFVKWIDERTQGRCTVLQLQALFACCGATYMLAQDNPS